VLADHEPVAERGGDQAGPRRRADERERPQRHVDRPRGHAVTERDVDPKVLHGRVQELLDRDRQAVDLVDEQDRPFGAVRQVGEEILGGGERRAAGDLQRGPEFPRDAGGERRLAEAGGAVEEDVAERLAPLAGRVDRDREPLVDGLLADHLLHPLRPQGAVFGGRVVGGLDTGLAEGFHGRSAYPIGHDRGLCIWR
jgi:hypothetical protein